MIQTEFPVDTEVLRSRIIETARSMNTQRLNVNKSGNVSARCRAEGGALAFLITPSGVPYDDLTPEDISRVTRLPTDEWRLHAAVYESKPEVRAIVHTHSPKATAVSCLESGIPPFHYMVAMSGAAEIPCAPYATFGTEALAESVTGALRHCRVCLMAHHGVLATGSGLPGAFALAVETENLASMYLDLLQLGDVRLLPEDEMARVLERFRTYGQPGRKA